MKPLPDYIKKYCEADHNPSTLENRKHIPVAYSNKPSWTGANPNVTERELLLDQPKAEMRRPRVKAAAA